MFTAYLLLGGNRGDVLSAFSRVYTLLSENGVTIQRRSSLYSSPAWGFADPNPFLNQVLEIQCELKPEELLRIILQIEKTLGRSRSSDPSAGYESRTIDIDILFFGEEVRDSDDLKIPHPRIHERKFTLLPLYELIPEFIHPLSRKSISRLLSECTDSSEVNKLVDAI